jgi:hypothetical protein
MYFLYFKVHDCVSPENAPMLLNLSFRNQFLEQKNWYVKICKNDSIAENMCGFFFWRLTMSLDFRSVPRSAQISTFWVQQICDMYFLELIFANFPCTF